MTRLFGKVAILAALPLFYYGSYLLAALILAYGLSLYNKRGKRW